MGWSLKNALGVAFNPVGTLINAGVDVITDKIADKKMDKSISASAAAQDKEMQFNAEQAQLNRDFQREERLATQEYNSISSQIQRMVEAGVNPALAFSNGYQSAESTPMSGASASYSSGLASSILTTMADRQLKMAQINNLNASALSTTISTKYIGAKAKADIAKIYSDIGVNDFNKDLQERTFALFSQKTKAECDVMLESLNKLRNESLEILKNIDLKDAEIQKIFSDIDLQQKQGDKIVAETEGQNINNDILRVVKEFSDATGIPLGASESQAIFKLWKDGKLNDVYDKIRLNSANSDQPISKATGLGGMALQSLGAGIDSLVKSIGSIFTK